MEKKKKLYDVPQLTVYGNVKTVTQVKPDGRPGKQTGGGDGESGMGWPSS